jgi:DNA-binding transcriptional regulator of glucitol operon
VLLTPRWVSWHLFAVAAVTGMIWLGDWQLRRALAGNTLSWAYTFEWPIFAVLGVAFWAKTVRDELAPASGEQAEQAGEVEVPAGARQVREPDHAEPEDVELAEYNAYLARLSEEAKGHGRWHGPR